MFVSKIGTSILGIFNLIVLWPKSQEKEIITMMMSIILIPAGTYILFSIKLGISIYCMVAQY